MKFSIITPTHNRPEQLLFCINSILNQDSGPSPLNGEGTTPFYIEMIVINDSPNYDYSLFENDNNIIEAIKNKTIVYIKNEKNYGKNYSCNLALAKININKEDNSDNYVIFLDDDDWLSVNALTEIYNNLKDKSIPWLVTNRCYENKESLTKNKTNKVYINYFWDAMIFKRFHGDATHTIESNLAKSAHFNTKVKNGKEWYYFAQLASTFIYKNLNTTITSGYMTNGLTDNLTKKGKLNKIKKLKETIYNLIILFTLRLKPYYRKYL